MLKCNSVLLVLLLASCSPPEPPGVQPATAVPPEAHGACSGRRRGSPGPHPQPLRLETSNQPPIQRSVPRWLQFWISWRSVDSSCRSGTDIGSSISSINSGSIRRGRFAGSTRGWGIRGAAAAILDEGGSHSDGSGLRGGRQAATFVSSSRSASAGGSGSGRGAGSGGGVCSDTCYLARNGVCEDGSNIVKLARDGGVQVACDFGTDCTDCGPYKGVVPTWGTEAGFKGPIDFLRRKGVKVYARRVTFEPRFVFAYTDPKEDLDVSEQMERAGCMELGIVHVFRQVLSERCAPFRSSGPLGAAGAQGLGSAPLVVDVGANFGYFAVYAAMLGCRVIAVEPVPRFLAFLHWNLAANGVRISTSTGAPGAKAMHQPAPAAATAAAATAVVVVDRVVSTIGGQNVTMAAPRRGVWGTASVAGMANNLDQDLEHITVGSARLDDIVGSEQVLLLKVDVEGYEPLVFRSGEKLVSERRVENIVMEYSPGMPETLERYVEHGAAKPLVSAEDPPKMLLGLLKHGFTVVQLPENFAKSGYAPELQDPMPELHEVTVKSVMYDITDVEWFRRYSAPGATCPWPSELRQANAAAWDGCLKSPDDSHPKGLRVTHSYNTNLWASRNRSALQISGPVGLFGPEQDEGKSWWSQRFTDKGVGNRACAYLPAGQLLRSRCRCSKPDVCGREEEVLLKALGEGRMPRPPAPAPTVPVR